MHCFCVVITSYNTCLSKFTFSTNSFGKLILHPSVFYVFSACSECSIRYHLRPKNNTLVSGNAGDEKNIHPVGHKFIFFNRFSAGILISSLVSFAFFDSCFLFCCFFELKNVYSDTHSTMRAGE